MSTERKSPLAPTAGALLLLATTAGGCAGLMIGGPHRSEQFPSGNAPEPTVATTLLACVSSALPFGSGREVSSRFEALARTAMPAPAVPLSPAATSALCSTVAASDAFHAWRETTPAPSAAAVIREIAQASGAKAIAMPALRLYAQCERDKKVVRDAAGATIATIDADTQTCRVDRMKDVGLFLFSADGTILYRSTKRVGMTSSDDPEPDMNAVLANIPATFAGPTGGAAAMSAPEPAAAPAGGGVARAAYTPPAAPPGVGPDDPQVDEALGALEAKTPGDCKKFAKKMCRNPSVPDASRLQMCAGYVKTVNQLVARQGAKAGDACKNMAKSAP